ncbi:[citrate (pro-3S)-lyase] ligase [Acidaminococcus timonensis]|uniref:[citrate (pro-3S)-lyase] ligase n=1 Tax=Acidaminococcus timonensis TaxID=1871002 RepID=UPI0025F2B589|nr:[citrate (pro-3S)-lyase] ligase [Acidaminococcus timonensis]
MSDYFISQVYPSDARTNAQVDALLQQEGIRRDANLDYTCVMFDNDYHAIATGSCFGNTLRCMAVDHRHQGEGLMNEIVSHLVQYQYERGNLHLFLYTKCSSAKFFGDLGFYEIARIEDQIVFMENRKDGFSSYLDRLAQSKVEAPNVGAVVMNANPFTLGHQYLVEKAAAENDVVHLFMVSEDASLFPYAVRKQLIEAGTAHLKNVRYHDSGPYIISQATFPSYFQKDAEAVIASHANLDLAIFTKIAHRLGITARYVGEEPTSVVTGLYNQVMQQKLPEAGIQCIVVPRREENGVVVSASTVRKAIQEDNWDLVQQQVPATTWNFLRSEAAKPIIARIKGEKDVVHY